jgi:hypothetical protein
LNAILFFYQLFAWTAQGPATQTSNSFPNLFAILNLTLATPYRICCPYFLNDMIATTLLLPDKDVIKSAVDAILNDFSVNATLDNSYFPKLIAVLKKRFAIQEYKLDNQAVSIVAKLFEDERLIIKGADYADLIGLITDQVVQLNVEAFDILCRCSMIDETAGVVEGSV